MTHPLTDLPTYLPTYPYLYRCVRANVQSFPNYEILKRRGSKGRSRGSSPSIRERPGSEGGRKEKKEEEEGGVSVVFWLVGGLVGRGEREGGRFSGGRRGGGG